MYMIHVHDAWISEVDLLTFCAGRGARGVPRRGRPGPRSVAQNQNTRGGAVNVCLRNAHNSARCAYANG